MQSHPIPFQMVSSQDTTRILVIGAGDCGTRAALRLRELGYGGEVVLVGEETRQPYERPPLSKELLSDDSAELHSIVSREGLQDAGIEWLAGSRAVKINREHNTVSLADGQEVAFHRLLLCTGSRARIPPLPGNGVVRTIRSADDVIGLRSQLLPDTQVLVIGGGFIGLEVAASARNRGCQVTVVEFAHEPMARVVPAQVARVLLDRHWAEGVDLRFGVGLSSLENDGVFHRATLEDGSEITADVVVAGVGAIPNTELAATAGLAISNGIAVDRHLCSSDPAIYAAGDCCSVPHPLYGNTRVRLEAWRNALAQSDVAARNLLGEKRVYDAVPVFWSDQYELTMHVVGLHDAATRQVSRRHEDSIEMHFGIDESGRVVSASGVAQGTKLARAMQIAERLIATRATPPITDLSDPTTDLRRLLG